MSIYWFNPLIWAAYILLCRDIELACDERVIKEMSMTEKKAYSETLLSCSVSRRAIATCPLSFGEVGVKQRIRNVLSYKKPAFWVIVIAFVSCAAVAVCFLTNPREAGADTEPQLINPKTEAIDYVFGRVAYMNPLSSYYPFNGTGQRYLLGTDSFAIVNEVTGETINSFTDIAWDWQPVTGENWSALFFSGLEVPDISAYKTKRMQKLSDTYRLLDMDGALWLMKTNGNGIVWSIYELTPEGSNQLTLQDVLYLSIQGDTLTWESLRPYAYEDIGSGRYLYVFPIGDGWRLTVNSGQDLVPGETIGEPVLLEYLPDNDYADIRTDDVAAFIAQKESVRTGVPIVFSGHSICSVITPGGDAADIRYIVIDPKHSDKYSVPFSVYRNGEEVNGGQYSVRDADTGEELEFVIPSGLSAQTYILQNAQAGHRYEITLRIRDDNSDESCVFGVYVN